MSVCLAAVSFSAKAAGTKDPAADFRVRKMLEGFKKDTPLLPDEHRPITVTLLHGLYIEFGLLCSSQFEICLFRTVTLVFFIGTFRVSELLAQSKGAPTVRTMQWDDCEITGDLVHLRLRLKTIN